MFDDSGAERSAHEPPGHTADTTLVRFRRCRWHDETDGAEYCRHGEVLPYAGRHGFSAQAWCPDCTFYKARRKARPQDGADLQDFDY